MTARVLCVVSGLLALAVAVLRFVLFGANGRLFDALLGVIWTAITVGWFLTLREMRDLR